LEITLTRFSKEDCLEDIKRRILSTDFAPGVDLDEASLCNQYGMSRTPLREVLQRLQGDGYVELAQNRGAKVASMDIGVLRVFFQTAPMVYANIAQLACENRTAVQLDRLKEAQLAFAKAAKASQVGDAALANHQFHASIGEMAHNPYLVASLARLQIDHTRLSQTFYRPSAPAETLLVIKAIDQHDAMISAFEAREGALAIDLTLQHWDLSRNRMERFVRPDPLPVDVISLKDRRNAI
jgi:DNA-binding GntR family transcriptional regulator